MLKKPLHFFELKEPLGGNKSDWNHLAFLCRCCILGQICFSHMWALRQARLAGRYTLKNISCMVITSCMSGAVSGFGAKLLLGGNVLCNILMACYRCFWYMHQRWARIRTGSGLKPILAGSGLDRTAIFLKIGEAGLDRTEKIFVVSMLLFWIYQKF